MLRRITLVLSICPCYEATLISYNQAVSKVPTHTHTHRCCKIVVKHYTDPEQLSTSM